MTKHASLAPLLERFFTQRLMQQRQASPHTIGSYRDTVRQLLEFAERTMHKPPSRLNFEEVDAPLIVAFLDELENHQGISVRSRNLRLTAMHSFFRYAAFEAPAHSAQISACSRSPVSASSNAGQFPDPPRGRCLAGRTGSIDLVRAARSRLPPVAVQTGLRLSEIPASPGTISSSAGAHVRVIGKGRKERCTPFAKPTAAVLKSRLKEPQRGEDSILFPSARGERLSVHGVQ